MDITNKLISYSDLTKKMQTLKRKCDTLSCLEEDIITQVQKEESSCTKKRRKVVENWLENVASTRNSVQNTELQVSGIGTSLRGLVGRNQKLVDRVEDLTREVAEYMEQGLFPQGLTLDDHEQVTLLTPKLVGKAFESNLETIWKHLKKEDVLIIGVWGMGGVGKTTLIKHIHNRILEHRDTFNQVYWITVSQNPSIRKLQDDIAKEICFDISTEGNESRRAAMLSRELMRRNRSVIILDDVWDDICLKSVGIATSVNGCKLIITTRSLIVCRRLCCQEKIKIESLSEEEAWYLFEKTLGHPKIFLSTEVLEVAKCVAQECAGLPLGIITLASCMREVNDLREWRSVLEALKVSEDLLMEEKVFKVLKLSYNRLNDVIVQKCFIYCALYPEDYQIKREELIQYLIDEGIIVNMRNRQVQFDRGHSILNKLVNSCLLEDVDVYSVQGGQFECVRMHDLVRDMALKIMGPQFMVKAGMQLEEIPEEQEWSKDVERVSLMNSKIKEIEENQSLPICHKLLTLFLSDNFSLKRVENSFFDHMPALKVLNLSYCRKIEELPSSISDLKNLSSLVLCFCSKLQHMPSLAEVLSLKRLDLSNSGIREVPHGLEMLLNLTYLDLKDTENLEFFPSGILPRLSRLEYLKFGLWKVKIKGEELKGLERLITFEGCLTFDDNVNGFKEYVMSRSKYVATNRSYQFRLDDGNKFVRESDDRRDLSELRGLLNKVELRNWSTRKKTEEDVNIKTLEALLKDVQSLQMENSKDARSLGDVRWLDNATQDLKRFIIKHCEGIECVGSFSSSSPLFYQTLEILSLESLLNLRILFEMEGEGGGLIVPPSMPVAESSVFSCLKIFSITFCNNMKKLFQPGFLPCLRNLEEIRVFNCWGLEEIIASTTAEEESISSSNNSSYHSYSDTEYSLPKLKTLYLEYLPKLKSICEGTMACEALEVIQVGNCPRMQRIPLSQPPSSLQSIDVAGGKGQEWWESLEWDDPDAKNLFQPYLKFTRCSDDEDFV